MPTTWRDLVKVHPAADAFPMMSEEELRALSKDIDEHGLNDPIIFWTPLSTLDVPAKVRAWPKEFYLLDGRNRLAAIDLLSDERRELWAFDNFLAAPDNIDPTPRTTLLYGEDCDPWSYVVSANVLRRHLTATQKREVVAALLKAKPERSDRATAKLAKVSDKTVASVRKGLEGTAEIPQLEMTVGADGRARSRPPHRTDSVQAVEAAVVPPGLAVVGVVAKRAPERRTAGKEPAVAPAQKRAQAIIAFAALLHAKLPDTLDDLTRLLRDECTRIKTIPLPKRITLTRGFLNALGVGLDDLRPIE
jgi:hypothetical protein